jgi:hypothetical protein
MRIPHCLDSRLTVGGDVSPTRWPRSTPRKHFLLFLSLALISTASVVQWSDFLAADPEVPGSIRGAARFSE